MDLHTFLFTTYDHKKSSLNDYPNKNSLAYTDSELFNNPHTYKKKNMI